MRKNIFKKYGVDEDVEPVKSCDYNECKENALYKAPKNRSHLRDYYWFCLKHVQAYNRQWDYYINMTTQEIEASRFFDANWERETKPFHKHMGNILNGLYSDSLHDPLNIMAHKTRHFTDTNNTANPFPTSSDEAKALIFFDISYPVQLHILKKRYLELVKKFHPDVCGLENKTDDVIKKINVAYGILKKIALKSSA